jgi:hypothetical protein
MSCHRLQVVATMDFGTTRVVKWMVYDNVDGDGLINYNCFNKRQKPITVLIKEFLKNPTLLVENDKGEMEFKSIELDNKFTTKLVVKAKKLGEDYMKEKNVAANARIKVLAKRADMSPFKGSDLVASPKFIYKKVFIYPLEVFLDDKYIFKKKDRKNGLNAKLIQQTRNLVKHITSETTCLPGFEQEYRNLTDVETPIFKRGELLHKLLKKSVILEDQAKGENRVLTFSDPDDKDAWVEQDFDDITEDFNWVAKIQNTEFVKKFAFEDTPDDFLEDLRASLLGSEGGLQFAQQLLDDLVALDSLLTKIYDLSTGLEGGLVNIYDMIVLVLKIEPLLIKIKKTLQLLNIILHAVGLWPPFKLPIIAVRKAINGLKSVVKKAIPKIHKISKRIKPNKRKVRKLLKQNEKFRTITAKISFVNENYLLVPTRTTRSCKSTDDGAKAVYDAIRPVNTYFDPLFNLIKAFFDAVEELRKKLADAISDVKKIFDALVDVIPIFDNIFDAIKPFYDALQTEISLHIPFSWPFCTPITITKRIAYPCGVKFCIKKRFGISWGYPCVSFGFFVCC